MSKLVLCVAAYNEADEITDYIKYSDYMIVYSNCGTLSSESICKIYEASYHHSIPVYVVSNGLDNDWIRGLCDRVFDSIDTLMDYVSDSNNIVNDIKNKYDNRWIDYGDPKYDE